MASTAIPAFKAAILEVLQAAESLDGITVTGDLPPERKSEYVWLGKGTGKREHRVIGPQPASQDERIEIELHVVAIKGQKEVTPAEERAVEIGEAVETVLRENPKLSGVFWQHVSEWEVEPQLFDRKPGAHAVLTISAKARI